MSWHNVPMSHNAGNDYSNLKWPLTFASILTTCLAIILLLSFRSDSWFTYEVIRIDNSTAISNTTKYFHLLEYGTLGLWRLCFAHYNELIFNCNLWPTEDRPHSFNILIILISCALFLTNLTVFPSWGSTILILYNSNNRYIRPICIFIVVLLFLIFLFTAVLIITVLFTSLTPFYAPGHYVIDSNHVYFQPSSGLLYASFASLIAIACLVLVIVTLIWKKIIEIRLKEAEKELLKQLSEDNFQPGWHKIRMAPETPSQDNASGQPPPYEYSHNIIK